MCEKQSHKNYMKRLAVIAYYVLVIIIYLSGMIE